MLVPYEESIGQYELITANAKAMWKLSRILMSEWVSVSMNAVANVTMGVLTGKAFKVVRLQKFFSSSQKL